MILKHHLIRYLGVDGVLIVQNHLKNCVTIKTANTVLKSLLLHIQGRRAGIQLKMVIKNHMTFLKIHMKSVGLNVINASMILK
jgi:hypothetical protein